MKRALTYLKPYIVTIILVSVFGSLKIWLNSVLVMDSPFLLFFTAVMLSAWYGGFRQGIFAGLLTVVFANYFFLEPKGIVIFSDRVWVMRLLLYLLDCTMITAICAALRTSRTRIHNTFANFKLAEHSLKQSENRFGRVFESRMIGLLFSQADGKILDANDYFLNLLGYTRNDILSGVLNWKTITPSEHLERSVEAVEELQTKGVITPFEKEYINRNGERVPVLIGATYLDDDRIVTFILDITERRRAEEEVLKAYNALEERVALRTRELQKANQELKQQIEAREKITDQMGQSQYFLDSVVENIPNMIFVKDAKELRFVRFNKAGEDLLGYSRDTLMGKNDYDFFPKDEADFFTSKDRAVLEGGAVVDIPDEPLTTRFGVRSLHTKKIPIFDKDGKPQYLLGISEDITEKKIAEQQGLSLAREQAARVEAEKSAERLSFLSEASATLNESLDIDSMLQSFAKTIISNMADWCRIDIVLEDGDLRRQIVAHRDPEKVKLAEELRKKFPMDWEARSGPPNVMRTGLSEIYPTMTNEMIRQGAVSEAHYQALKKLGMHSIMIVPLKSYGKVLGSITFVSAESGRTFDHMDLSIAEDLAKRAFFAIENAQLFHKAQEASRAKSSFLANMSHEIRTPLGAMLGFAELLLDDKEEFSADQANSIATIKRNGQQLLKIVDEILDISKVESERIFIEKTPFSLPSLIEEVTSLLRRQASEKNLKFAVISLSQIPERIISDPTRLRQILINIVGNAIKFTEKGKIEVGIQLLPPTSKTPMRMLEITVSDTGIGISSDQAQRLFQPFSQADNSTTRRFGGTGLGLFISRKLARLLDGDLILQESAVGQGSRFVLTVQVETLHPKVDTIKHKPLSPTSPKTPHYEQNRILIVDDVQDNRALIKHFVSRLGLQVDFAESGAEGVSKALQTPYDVVLMDIQMPGMDGFEAVQKLREGQYHRPVIALTANAMKGDRENCLNKGFDDYLAKPISRDSLEKSLIKYLKPVTL